MDGQVPILRAIEHDVLIYGEVAGRVRAHIVLRLKNVEEAREPQVGIVEVEDLDVLTKREAREGEKHCQSRRMGFDHLINNIQVSKQEHQYIKVTKQIQLGQLSGSLEGLTDRQLLHHVHLIWLLVLIIEIF